MKGFQNDLLVIVLIALGFTACDKGLETYHGNNSIYFTNNKTSLRDTGFMTFGFSKLTQTDSVISIPVSALGIPAGTDRTFKVMVVADSSTALVGVHYDALPEMIVPAGAVGGIIKLKLHRTPDIQTTPVCLYLQLLPNENFTTDLVTFSNTASNCKATTYKLWADDMLGQPLRWYVPYMGIFSKKKVYLTAAVLGLDLQEMIKTLNSVDGTVALNSQIAWGRAMKLYLSQQAAAGTPVYEDNGVLMAMGTSL